MGFLGSYRKVIRPWELCWTPCRALSSGLTPLDALMGQGIQGPDLGTDACVHALQSGDAHLVRSINSYIYINIYISVHVPFKRGHEI